MAELVQVKGIVPKTLKRRVFIELASRDQKFTWWLRMQMETYIQQVEGKDGAPGDERLVRSATRD